MTTDRRVEGASTRDLVVKGSMGQPVTNSLVTEIRHHRTAVGTLLARIDLEDDDEPSSGRSTRSEVGRKLARVRWDAKASADGA